MIVDSERKRRGRLGEDIACQFLMRKGYRVLERNFRRLWGEIDIIATRAGTIRFVEVKAVSREKGHHPEDLVDARKLRKIARTAVLYMENKGDDREYQIDVVAVILNERARTARCRLIEQALDSEL